MPLCRALVALVLVMLAPRGAAAAGIVYALNQVNGGTNRIFGYQVSDTGVLTPIAGFPVASGGNGGAGSFSEHLAFRNGLLFVVNAGSASLSVFSVNPVTGILTPRPYSPIALGGDDLACVSASPVGRTVVVGSNAGLWGLVVTPAAATIAAGSPVATPGARPFTCGFSRDGRVAYTGGNAGRSAAGFTVNPSTGGLTARAGSPLEAVLSPVVGARAPDGLTGAVQGILHQSGFYMVADRAGNRVGVYRVSGSGAATTLTAVAGSPFPSGGIFTDAVAGAGPVVIAANGISRNLTAFRVDSSTGALTSLGTQPADTAGSTGIITGLAFVPGTINEAAPAGTPAPATVSWGVSTDIPVSADFDGDGEIDPAIFRPSTGRWTYLTSSTGYSTVVTVAWGLSTDRPVAADFDGDGMADPAVYRPSTGLWAILKSSTHYNTSSTVSWGRSGDLPAPVDYDGDGKSDPAVFRVSTGECYVLPSSANYASGVTIPAPNGSRAKASLNSCGGMS